MCRALEIDEGSYGKDHPDVAIDLNNLALLLRATNRLGEAQPLMRRALEIFLKFTRDNGNSHPHLQAVISNYTGLLQIMGRKHKYIQSTIVEMGQRFGIDLGGVQEQKPTLFRKLMQRFQIRQ